VETVEVKRMSVFLVHGHDSEVRHAVEAFLMKLGLEVIVLAERPNAGRTIIEKFEAESTVGYAVVLLTPDDIVASSSGTEQIERARQNVIFELGFFAGRLGRNQVCLLRKGDVEIPSDLAGVGYVPWDGHWKLDLARELKAGGFAVDLNKAL
jgi:predicted nucleotide-binding protein